MDVDAISLPENQLLDWDDVSDMKLLRKQNDATTVFTGWQVRQQRQVVVKKDSHARHEADILNRLSHTHIVELVSIIEPVADDLPRVVVEYVSGGDLGLWLGLTELHWSTNGLRVCKEVSSAVEYLHALC
jgi:serine/threonine protein kinase